MSQSRCQFGKIQYHYVVTTVWERIIRAVGICTVALFVVITITPATNAIGRRFYVTSGQLKPVDAIVVLGAGILHGGVLSDQSLQRFITGIALFRMNLAPILV